MSQQYQPPSQIKSQVIRYNNSDKEDQSSGEEVSEFTLVNSNTIKDSIEEYEGLSDHGRMIRDMHQEEMMMFTLQRVYN